MGCQKGKAFGVESAGKYMREFRPSGPAVRKRQSGPGIRGRRCLIKYAHLAGEGFHKSAGLGQPGPEVEQTEKALAQPFGDGIGAGTLRKALPDFKDVAELPPADGKKIVGQP